MRKMKRGILAALMLAVLSVAGLPAPDALASDALAVEIPVEVTLSGTLPQEKEEFTLLLQAEEAANPMPQGSGEGRYALTVTGERAGSFPVIRFSSPGVYHYSIHMQSGDKEDCTYDSAIYHMTVSVTNDEAGGLSATSVLYKNEESNKLECAAFHNEYVTETEPETETETETEPATEPQTEKAQDKATPKTGDDTNLTLWIFLMGAAVIAVLEAMNYKIKRTGKGR